MRKDLTIEQQICQASHASYEAGIRFGDIDNIHSIVICQIENEQKLLQENKKLNNRGIRTFMFYEPDLNNQATALASELIEKKGRRIFSKYKLWGC